MSSLITISKKRIDGINRCHIQIEGMGMTLLEAALEAGQALSAVKSELPHGTFMEWVRVNLKFSHKTATNYMRLHELELADKLGSVANIGEAYRLITSPPKITTSPATAPRPSPASSVIVDAEIVEPSAPVTEAEPQHEERAQEIAADEDRLPLDDQKTAAILEPQEFYGLILSMLPHLTKSEIKSLIETLNTRWT